MMNNNNPVKLTSSLARVQSNNIDHIANQGDALIEQAQEEHHNWVTRQLDPRQRELRRGELDLIRLTHKARRKQLEMVKEAQLQALKESCNQYLDRGKAKVRSETALFLIEQAQQLLEDADRIADKFINNIQRKADKLDSITVPRLRQRVEDQLNQEMDDFFDLQDQLMAKYKNIVSEGV